jgi:hypothetical protein
MVVPYRIEVFYSKDLEVLVDGKPVKIHLTADSVEANDLVATFIVRAVAREEGKS